MNVLDATNRGLSGYEAASIVLPLLRQRFRFKSLVDIGCGCGTWVKAANELPECDVLGIDRCAGESDCDAAIQSRDLERQLDLGRRFDIALCLEVAEHLSARRSKSFVNDLVNLADVLVFSAAIPGQGGHGHINERWPEFWAKHFFAAGFLPWTGVRKMLWREKRIPWWYRQNLIVYVKASRWADFLPDEVAADISDLTRVHPECLLWKSTGSQFNAQFKKQRDRWLGPRRSKSDFNVPSFDCRRKIIRYDELVAWRDSLRSVDRPLVVTNGCFALVHAPHVAMLEEARRMGAILLVGVTCNEGVAAIKGERQLDPETDRARVIAALESVSAVSVFPDRDARRFLEISRPDIYVKGGDYTMDTINQKERRLLERMGVPIIFTSRVKGPSTTDLFSAFQKQIPNYRNGWPG